MNTQRQLNQPEIAKVAQLHQPESLSLYPARVTAQLSDEIWLLDNIHQASRAFSCLIMPEIGDQVLYASLPNQILVISILKRALPPIEKAHNISLPQKQAILIEAETLQLVAKRKLSMSSFGDIEINAILGKLQCNAKHFLQTIQQSLVQISKQMISRAEHLDQSATKLLKTHGRHQIITADREMKIDADRINMG